MDVSEKLRQQLLAEEFKLRAKQPTAWTKIKYRKNVKLPKDLMRKLKRKMKGRPIKQSRIRLYRKKFPKAKKKKKKR
jgi:hypothetical protein